jgi:hypothetical protein
MITGSTGNTRVGKESFAENPGFQPPPGVNGGLGGSGVRGSHT